MKQKRLLFEGSGDRAVEDARPYDVDARWDRICRGGYYLPDLPMFLQIFLAVGENVCYNGHKIRNTQPEVA